MKIYCSSCGHGMAYTSEKPNFCQKCGKGFRKECGRDAHVWDCVRTQEKQEAQLHPVARSFVFVVTLQ